MAFKTIIASTLDFPVNVDLPDGARRRNFFFHLTGQLMSTARWRELFGDNAENPNLKIADFLRANLLGWRGQQLVVDDASGKPADFSLDALDCMLDVVGIKMIIFLAYQKAIIASDGDAGRRKNSNS